MKKEEITKLVDALNLAGYELIEIRNTRLELNNGVPTELPHGRKVFFLMVNQELKE